MAGGVTEVRAETIGEVWLDVARRICMDGQPGIYDGLSMIECTLVSLVVEAPSPDDPIVERFGDAERLSWMHANFTDFDRVTELDDADSYATRLYDYAHAGHDQVAWVIQRLRTDPTCRSAAISTLQPLTDTSYIPCVSLLDFYLEDDRLELAVYAHSVDFGTKGYANLVELARIHHHVANELQRQSGSLTVVVKSAHIYDPERPLMAQILSASGGERRLPPSSQD